MKIPKGLKYIQIAVLVIMTTMCMGTKYCPSTECFASPESSELSYVERVVDGDTLKLSTGERVRLIGVDTPEVHYSDKLVRDSKKSGRDIKTIQAQGARSSEFTKGLCQGRKVRLEYDVEKRDRYGRLLAYVYLDDGTFVNARIIEEGYGQTMTIPPNVRYADLFRKLEKQARENDKGLWKSY